MTVKAKIAEELEATLVDEVREDLRAGVEGLTVRAQEGVNDLESLIKEHPVQSVLVAFGIGFVLSRVVLR
ncbi:MAG: hypothetical protein ACOH12_15065 [Parvibaculaceae bacterium]